MLTPIGSQAGKGGAGLSDGSLFNVLRELQGMAYTVLTGVAVNTKINVAAIRREDTILSAIHFVGAGVAVTDILDITSGASIAELRPSGTLSLGTPIDGSTCVIRGRTYTFRTTPNPLAVTAEVALGVNITAAAVNLVAKIKQVDGILLTATSAIGVITVIAIAEGTAGNAYTIVGSAQVTASGATLAGGSATGGVKFTADTSGGKVLLVWANKR